MTCRVPMLLLIVSIMLSLSAWADNTNCQQVGGVLMTDINVIKIPNHQTNLGPVFGDLAGAVAATILGGDRRGNYLVQHYWVTESGDTIKFDVAVLTPTTAGSDVAAGWGNYRSNITGGTGKFKGATGYLDYFGLADFSELTLVLRYRGQVCYAGSQ